MGKLGRPAILVTDDQKLEIAKAMGRDINLKQIARDLGISYGVVKRTAREPDVVATALKCRQEHTKALLAAMKTEAELCGSAWKRDPGSGVIGVEKGPLIPVV